MSKFDNLFTTIRNGFADAKFIFTNIPKIINGVKSSAKKEMLKVHFHNICDKAVEAYGDVALAYVEKVDINVLQNIAEDLILLTAKYKDPLYKMAKATSEAVVAAVNKYDGTCADDAKAIGDIVDEIAESLGLKDLKMPSEQFEDENRAWELKEKEAAFNLKVEANSRKHAYMRQHLTDIISENEYKLTREGKLGGFGMSYDQWLAKTASELVEAVED